MFLNNVHFSIFIIQTIIVTFGTLCNILSFIVWSKGKICSGLPIALYFRILAAVDTFILLVPGIELLLYVSPSNFIIRNHNSVTCRLYPGLTSSSIRVSSWIIASFTIERTLYIYFTSKFRVAQNSTRTILITLCLIVASLLMDLPLFTRSELLYVDDSSNRTLYNVTANVSNAAMSSIHGRSSGQYQCQAYVTTIEIIIDGVTKFLLTLIILIICNTLILTQFRRQRQFSVRMGSQKAHEKRQANYRNAIYQMIGISFFHCVSTAPWSILAACREFGCKKERFYYELLLAFNSLSYLNSAINVILYCLIGNYFRRDLKTLFCKKAELEPPSSQVGTISSRVID